ncbi:hypothetical protein [Marinobacter sp. ANT_B65]|uniref:hypothetical protein n=1 Tax=Marinobacter sp. ANT_B65 TaxID=2039467 RepID=UPI000BBEACD3|nr:hypothetical protein [Marinobacter sp. ANT_B65]PCM43905.1 hypothetical protein CPA50_10205 [Marinobacter sp. ANT_B65]
MSHLIDRLVQRSIVEQFWDIVLDTDEVPMLPNEEALLAQIEAEAETDDEASDELLLQYLDAHARHFNTAPLIGGPLPDFADIAEVDGEPIMVGIVVPSLRMLKPFCSRIVTKMSGLGIKVGLFIDGPISPGLTREQLILAGKSFREELEKVAADEEDASLLENAPKRNRKAKRKKNQPIAIIFELIQVGDHIDTPAARAALRDLKLLFNRKERVFICGTLIDSATHHVWTTSGLGGLQRRRNWRYALANSDQGPTDIREDLRNSRFNWKLVLVAVMMALFGTGFSYYLQLQGSPRPFVMFSSDVLIPLVTILGAVSFNRLHHQSARQTKYFLIGYFGIYITAFCWLVWPVSLAFALYLAKVTLLVSFISMIASTMMELE